MAAKKKKVAAKVSKKAPAKRAAKPADVAYVLRCCDSKRRGYGGFQWPESGHVEAPDWDPRAVCGNGLHGWLNGEGDVSVSAWHAFLDAVWLVLEVDASTVVDLGGKVKFPRANVVFCGKRDAAVAEMARLCPGRAVVYGTATAGDVGTATAGYAGTATAGDDGTATAGARGTATAGARGTATAGYAGTATAGDDGIIVIRRWNGKRWKLVVGYIGEDGLGANVAYRLDESGAFVRAKP